MASINIKTTSNFCNRWPELSVTCDDVELFRDTVQEQLEITLQIPEIDSHTVKIGMFNKHFGEDNIWDTEMDDAGNILNDLVMSITDVCVNDISIKNLLQKNLFTVHKSSGQDFLDDKIYSDGCFNFNGYFEFRYSTPIINSIINQKFKTEVEHDKSYFSNYTKVFHYEDETRLIKEIYEIVDEVK